MSTQISSVKLNAKNLKSIQYMLKRAKGMHVRVGVMGDTSSRTGVGPNNATIGMTHEFGAGNIPARSFLRVPIITKLPKQTAAIRGAVVKAIKAGDLTPAFQTLGLLAEAASLESFATSGDGKWAPNAPDTIARKGHDMQLIDTNQLRRAVTSRVMKK